MPPEFQLSSPVFANDASIPTIYTCKGVNASPPLHIDGTPEATVSLALVLHDPDAPSGDYLHWTMWNMSPETTTIGEDTVPWGAVQGTNDFGEIGYSGPCPPSGTHHYHFDLYALDDELTVPVGAKRGAVMEAIEAHAIATTTLIGTFSASA